MSEQFEFIDNHSLSGIDQKELAIQFEGTDEFNMEKLKNQLQAHQEASSIENTVNFTHE